MAKILVVDTSPDVATPICRALEMAGHTVLVVYDEDRALGQLAGESCDLIVTDHDLGSSDCLQFLLAGLESQPETMPKRILIMSGNFPADIDDRVNLLCRRGFVPLTIDKPFRLDDLISLVDDLLSTDLPVE